MVWVLDVSLCLIGLFFVNGGGALRMKGGSLEANY